MALARVYPSTADDASDSQDGTTSYQTGTNMTWQRHTTTANARTAGMRYAIPESLDVTAVMTSITWTITALNASTFYGLIAVGDNENTPFSTSSRPSSRYAAAAAARGTVRWDQSTTTTINTQYTSPSIEALVVDALLHTVPVDGYRWIAIYFQSDIGAPANVLVATNEQSTYGGPFLTINTVETATAPVTDIDFTGVSALGTSSGATARVLDLYRPVGDPPVDGWPVVMFVHGGRWVSGTRLLGGSENATSAAMVQAFNDQGWAVVAPDYRMMQENVNPGSINRSFPQNVHDVVAAMEWIKNEAGTYDLNADRVVMSGHSAGGHLAGFAAVSAATGDSTTYDGSQNNAGNRSAGYGYSNSASPWQFDFDESGELTPNPPIGILMWDVPVSVYQVSLMGGATGTANQSARKALYGEPTGGTVASTEDDADLDKYIGGGNVYPGVSNTAAIPPIMMIYSSTPSGVSNAASDTALYNGLNAIAYDVSASLDTVNSVGYNRVAVPRIHAEVLKGAAPEFSTEVKWLRGLIAESETFSDIFIGSTAVNAIYVGDTQVDKIYLGDVEIL